MSTPKVILITGANTGLGHEIAKALCGTSTAYKLYIGSRSTSKGTSSIEALGKEYPNTKSSLRVLQVDLSSDSSLEAAVQEIEKADGKLDVLINNAGGSFDAKIAAGELSIREAWNTSWDTNVAGTQVLTTLAAPLLLKSSDPRLLFITSGTSSLIETDDFKIPALARLNASPAPGWPKEGNSIVSYRSTKVGLNMLMRDWFRVLKGDGVKVWAVSPGFLATGLGGVGTEQLKKVSIHVQFVFQVTDANFVNSWVRLIRLSVVGLSRMLWRESMMSRLARLSGRMPNSLGKGSSEMLMRGKEQMKCYSETSTLSPNPRPS